MNKYTTHCTEEQTKKAFELGAPLEFIPMFRYGDNSLPKFVHKNKWNRDEFCYCPTAEQIISWLEEHVEIDEIAPIKKGEGWVYVVFMTGFRSDIECLEDTFYPTRKEATLAAIDAALDFLSK